MRPLLSITFFQGFQISKNIEHPTSGSGGKKTFKRYLKSEHTHTQTDGRTDRQKDISTYIKLLEFAYKSSSVSVTVK